MLEGSGIFAAGVECEVMEVDDQGRILKMRATNPHPDLAKKGFFYENGEYVIWEYQLCPN